MITVPDVTNIPQVTAEADIVAAGLTVGTVTTAYSDTVAVDDVISQSPIAGTSVVHDSAVGLVVSLGIEMITVPDVTNIPQVTAEADIVAAGLTVGTVTTAYSDTVAVDDVISQSPVAGTSVVHDSAVGLVVSLGIEMITVPDVTGIAQTTAEANIVAAGLTVGTITVASSETVAVGDVISQNPTAGASVVHDFAVGLVISQGDTTPPIPATFLSAPSAISSSAISMTATPGSDPSGPVQYLFTCTAGGGNSSGWQVSSSYTDSGLSASTQYTYTIQMRDSAPTPNVGAASSPASATTIDPLISHWPFEADANDIEGGFDGTLENTAAVTNVPGESRIGTGVVTLDGINEYVSTSYAGISGSAARTTSAWFKSYGSAGAYQSILSYGGTAAGSGWSVRINNSDGSIINTMVGGDVNSTATGLVDGQWHHVAVTFPDGGTIGDVKIYIDGNVDAGIYNGSTQTVNTGSDYAVEIGMAEGGTIYPFNGQIDDVRVHDRELPAADILALYEANYIADIDGDGSVGLGDFVRIAESWGMSGCGDCLGADFTGDGDVDVDELLFIAAQWLYEG